MEPLAKGRQRAVQIPHLHRSRPFGEIRLCQILLAVAVPGFDSQSFPILGERLVGSPEPVEFHAAVVVRHKVLVSHFDGMRKQGQAVLPNMRLAPREDCPNRDDEPAAGRHQVSPRQPPHDRDQQPDHGDIHVAISHGLLPDLDQTDDRQQCQETPTPSNRQPRLPQPLAKRSPGDQAQNRDTNVIRVVITGKAIFENRREGEKYDYPEEDANCNWLEAIAVENGPLCFTM
jgi:hypothetical protein